MTRFSFRLESLLTLRQSERNAKRSELAAACAEQGRIADRRELLLAEQQRQREAVRAATAAGPIDVRALRAGQSYDASLRASISDVGRLEQQAAALVESIQAELTAAQLEVEVLEKLRQRQHDQHQVNEQRAMQRQLDEIAAIQHAR